jgi:hypothetical protein
MERVILTLDLPNQWRESTLQVSWRPKSARVYRFFPETKTHELLGLIQNGCYEPLQREDWFRGLMPSYVWDDFIKHSIDTIEILSVMEE